MRHYYQHMLASGQAVCLLTQYNNLIPSRRHPHPHPHLPNS